MTKEIWQTIIEWHGPDYAPDCSILVLISTTDIDTFPSFQTMQVGHWDIVEKAFSTLQADGEWQIIGLDEIQCWAFWPHPPGSVPAFAKDTPWFEKVVKQ